MSKPFVIIVCLVNIFPFEARTNNTHKPIEKVKPQKLRFITMIFLFFILPRLGGPFAFISNVIDIPFNWLWNAMFWVSDKLTFFVDLLARAVLA